MEYYALSLLSALHAARPAAAEPAQALVDRLEKAPPSASTTPDAALSSTRMASAAETRFTARQQRGHEGLDFSMVEDRENDPKAFGVSNVTCGQELRRHGVAIRQSSWKALEVQQMQEACDNDVTTDATAGAAATRGEFVE